MPKKKEYSKLTVKCDKSKYVAESIVETDRVEEMKRRCLKSLIDFIDDGANQLTFTVDVEQTKERPAEGVDLTLKTQAAKHKTETSEVDYVNIEGEN